MIQQDCAGIFEILAEGSDFRVAVFKRADIGGVKRVACGNFQVRVALRAADVASSDDVHAAAMLDVAGSAVGHFGADLVFMVLGAVVAGEASGVGGFSGEFTGSFDVAGSALFFEDGVRAAHAAAGVDVRVADNCLPGKPTERQ
ncbi:MAG TPA: hypothetical protein VGG94_01240 [Chthoniobacterales bacterium]